MNLASRRLSLLFRATDDTVPPPSFLPSSIPSPPTPATLCRKLSGLSLRSSATATAAGFCVHLSLTGTSSVCVSASASSSPVWVPACMLLVVPNVFMKAS